MHATIVDSHIDRTAQIQKRCNVRYSTICKYSYLGEGSDIVFSSIGKFCSIAKCCTIGGASHKLDAVSTSPLFIKGRNIFNRNFAYIDFIAEKKTTIGDDVWIGNHAIVLQGRTVGTGAVIGAGSVVTKDVPPYAIIAGNPGHIIRYRFEEHIIKALLETKWWEADDETLKFYGSFYNDPIAFIKALHIN